MKLVKYDENQKTIYENVEANLKGALKVIEVNIHDTTINNHVPNHWHNSIEIILPVYNSTLTQIDNLNFEVKPGEYLIINSRCVHNCRTIDPEHVKYYGFAIQLRYTWLKDFIPDIDHIQFISDENHIEIYTILQKIVETYKSDQFYKDIKLQSLAFDLIYALLSHQTMLKVENKEKDQNKELVLQVSKYIEDHYSEPLEVSKIAEQFHISYGYLANLFKIHFNFSIKEYISYVRIKKSEYDLKYTDLEITEIYLKNGFSNNKSFYHEFNKYHTVTPKEYRHQSSK